MKQSIAFILTLIVSTLASLVTPALANSAQLSQNQQAFLDAYDAVKKQDRKAISQYKKQLKDYELYPYILYYDYKKNFNSTPERLLQHFIDTEKSYLSEALRTHWLTHLGQKKQWQSFLNHYTPQSQQTLQCYFVQAAYAKGNDYERKEAKVLAREMWRSTVTLRGACAEVDTLLRKNKQLTGSLIWQRIAYALDHKGLSRAQYLRRDLSPKEQKMLDTWISWVKNPKAVAKGIPSHLNEFVRRHAFEDAIKRLSRIDNDLAKSTLEKYGAQSKLSEQELLRLERNIALRKAYRYKEDAEELLANVNENGGATEDSLRWQAQIDIRNSDWNDLLEVIALMPKDEQRNKKWRYWKARALEQQGQTKQAQALYRDLASLRDYYGFLAADKIGADYQFNPKNIKATPEAQLIKKYPALARIKELIAIDWQKTMGIEWRHLFETAKAEDLPEIAYYAHKLEEHAIAIQGLAKAKEWDIIEIRFPTPYKGAIMQSAQKHKVDPAWVYGIIRRESAYNEDIRSHAGALGLMQIMPKTAKFIGKRIGNRHTSKSSLLNPNHNIELGSAYISYLNNKFNGNPVMATAAYNAGPHRVDAWTPKRPLAADQWIDTIPFTETRQYVKAVLEYRTLFKSILNQRYDRLSDLMPPVGEKR